MMNEEQGVVAEFIDEISKFLEGQDLDSWCAECQRAGHKYGPCDRWGCNCPCDLTASDLRIACSYLKAARFCIKQNALVLDESRKDIGKLLIENGKLKTELSKTDKKLWDLIHGRDDG